MAKRYIDAERMPNDSFWEGLNDKEKAKVLQWLLQSPTVDVVEIDEMLDWCRTKLSKAQKDWEICSSDKRLEGYEKAMKSVMSYLRNKKGNIK